MDRYAVIVRAAVAPDLAERQVAAIAVDAKGTLSYDSRAGVLRLTASTETAEMDVETALKHAVGDLRRAVRRHAGEAVDVREGRVLPWDEFEAETFRPSAPRGGLAGVSEVTEILGVSRARVYQLAEDHEDFPRPVQELKAGPVWDRAEVEAWERGWERKRTGRPRKEK